jgi:membrane protein
MLAGKGFRADRCALTASGLTYYTLLSIVPLFAMLFGIAKGFGLHKALEVELLEKFSGQEAILTQVFDFSQSLLQNTKGGLIAGLGVGLLFWTIIKLLANIERSFNHIWEVKQARSFVRRFSDYLSIMLVCPLALIISSGATIFFTAQVK